MRGSKRKTSTMSESGAKVLQMNCPTCTKEMDFIVGDERWWCNPCLKGVNGPPPKEGSVAPPQVSSTTKTTNTSKASDGLELALLSTELLFYLLPIGAVIAGVVFLSKGSTLIGSILIGLVIIPIVVAAIGDA
jgi:hypothetical protein